MIDIVGFTGSREGMSDQQIDQVARWFKDGVKELHHGDCIGADALAHLMAKNTGIRVVTHPPIDETYRAFCKDFDSSYEPTKYGIRNQRIVDKTDALIATPSGPERMRGSGTWWAVRMARKANKPLFVVMPDGSVRNS